MLFGHVIASLVMAPSTGTTRYAVLREDGVGGEGDDESSGVHADDTDDAPVPFWDEARGQINMALPVSLSMVCNRVLSLTSVAFVGHLGALPLAAAALATTLGNVSGNSVMVGMASASSTIGGQAFGARHDSKLGDVLQRCLLILTLACVPIAFVWANATEVLLKLGQSTEIANLSGVYMRCLTPGLLFYAWNISVQTYMQSQRITKPSAVAGVVAAVFHVPLNYLFIFQFGWGYKGAAIATSTSNGVVLAMNVGYLRFWKKDGVDDDDKTSLRTPRENTTTWTGWSVSAATSEWCPFLRLALPGILMMAEWWASELNIILAGWLPDPERNVAAVSIFQITNALAFMFPIGFSVAALTRVSNFLGARAPMSAKFASDVAFKMILVVEVIISLVILSVKDVWAELYTSDTKVIKLVSKLLTPLAIYTAFDGALCVATGTIKACGKQWVAGPVVLFSYYVVGIPLAYWLAFSLGKGAMGLAIGATVGTMLHSVLIIAVVWRTDWGLEARRAAERVGGPGDLENSERKEQKVSGETRLEHEKKSNLGWVKGENDGGIPRGETLLPSIAEVELTDVNSDDVKAGKMSSSNERHAK